ncbi:helix-hairpin-helix domain-containing protein [Sulfurimonas lithotrophica]|uniref:Helix-hairpin-helix domain-containing protein n=1 Tax=Sulfurimonas lithotrophica TaxID=2590022 RepID=A0A5P8NZJ2_9BACT|nr:helix-hairpin-helix domain-containing protein [Sulfurimonas lithotrophica]QFR48866.1 helix-hairpin-helix domain-containing protein [Sulfurimonas lithotrophica]
MKILLSLVMLVGALFASIDINNADAKSLANLKGVGAKKAEAIVAYRNTNGCFSKLEDLANVKGIGSKTIEKNKADLVLGECKK